MSEPVAFPTGNLLLAALLPDDLALLHPLLVRASMRRELMMIRPNEPIEQVWFPEDGVASIVAISRNMARTEVGIFGREGFSGTALLLGAESSPHETFMQVEGRAGLRIQSSRLLDAVDKSASLRTALLRYVHSFVVQTAHSTVSNAHQRIEARLARWLLMCHDRVENDEIALTHEFMAMMIAAERSGVTTALHTLEGEGMIRSRRGQVIILDRDKLEELAGEGYGQPEAEYRRLVGPFGKHGPKAVPARPSAVAGQPLL